ncbi:CubicO group peptidase (beta-lactamase class C family) [Enterococcus sp. PF1-24]|uniref:serine hydrolase domain-containing protein n=1 Tax=unclassified Enterococcus TaxID=2608891 RepID=UPI0024759EE0|nr:MULTISPECIES: serine hydrolase [unclassified Enterococcus]MDH6363754.1 CubicO group peptidase (beta-lactamase class C family) [Enterococcus sp. PFB1-1]MDH6400710.1 CubicO group peptidase (beta-lactamase class C family) [Enterococcus sp. PF1-24]
MNQKNLANLEAHLAENSENLVGLVVYQDNQLQYEKYFNQGTATSPVHVYSVTKSMISLLVGIALDKGYLENIQRPILSFFPEYAVAPEDEGIKKITIEDLLTMTVPYKFEMPPYLEYFTSDDSVRFTLDLLAGKDEVGKFNYTPLIGPDILSAILVRSTGKSVLDFACENLFTPLGITVEKSLHFKNQEEQMAFNAATTISGWVTNQQGVQTAGWGLSLTARDMAKIGQLFLNEGLWQGQQLISSVWLTESTSTHSRWEEMRLDYGYLWWVLNQNSAAAMGDGGNVIYFNRQQKLVVAINALFAENAGDRLKLIKELIEPVFAR